uniref:Uncharacterized protein n=1 Tax=Palpitomonas bilix TaxID=652834 RepID=A0A7S3GE76_9EUKA|mmetsp:Transcript_45688/g.118084  ORF Transcript_45688/g.118084 Transcript_45688/m.118084 type:complete len:108 (+) Transcript_45688:107-430(+)
MAEYKKAKGEAVDYSGTLPPSWKRVVEVWLDEDVPNFDAGGYVVGDKESTAFLLGKSDGVLAGAPFFEAIFNVRSHCSRSIRLSKFFSPLSLPMDLVIPRHVLGFIL